MKKQWQNNKKTILVIDKPRKRSPLLTQFISRLSRSEKFNIIISDKFNSHITQIIDFAPDYIYCGFFVNTVLEKSYNYINRHNIKIILDINDVEEFTDKNKFVYKNVINIKKIDYVICRWDDGLNMSCEHKLDEFMYELPMFKNTKKIYIPWGIDLDIIKPHSPHNKREIDVLMACTRFQTTFKYHKMRNLLADIIKTIFIPGLPNTKFVVDEIYGNKYYELIRNSKMFILEPSLRQIMTQKYLEIPICGAMPIGKLPLGAAPYFKDGVSFVDIPDWNIKSLFKKILYYKYNNDKRKEIALNAQKIVIDNLTIDRSIKTFEMEII